MDGNYILSTILLVCFFLGGGKQLIVNIIKEWLFPDYKKRFIKQLRKTEYINNCCKSFVGKIRKLMAYRKLQQIERLCGYEIPLNVFGPGLSVPHFGTIVVNGSARIGANCRIHVGVNIGTAKDFGSACPKIGDNVYIGPGAKLFGDIVIADGCVIGANAVVCKSCFNFGKKLIGVPAKEH